MSLDADQIVDRRRMRRKLTFWRVFAVLLAICAVIGIGAAVRSPGMDVLTGRSGASIARVTITGLIRSDQDRVAAFDRLANSRVKAVIVHINSPGGTTAGSEELHHSLIGLKSKKPMVVVVDGLAASGGYIAAIAADHIVAQETSLVGSIGVLFQFPNVGELLSKVGVSMEEIKSSPLKAAPNGFEPTSPAARAAIADLVKDSYDWFRDLVKTRRQLDDAGLDRVADGRVFTGRQGVPLRLVDELGDEQTAIAWLAKESNIDPKTPVRDYPLHDRFSDLPFLHTAAGAILDAAGLGALARHLDEWGAVQTVDRLNLDGLLALWHP
ncbi:MAG TPA: signal peptide peptidase SppA [Xanthobacteraceae bacterium]|jgi:protease-4|nr:signal peptide peptidase SppA [Xanthobacteraceae bacterium]